MPEKRLIIFACSVRGANDHIRCYNSNMMPFQQGSRSCLFIYIISKGCPWTGCQCCLLRDHHQTRRRSSPWRNVAHWWVFALFSAVKPRSSWHWVLFFRCIHDNLPPSVCNHRVSSVSLKRRTGIVQNRDNKDVFVLMARGECLSWYYIKISNDHSTLLDFYKLLLFNNMS